MLNFIHFGSFPTIFLIFLAVTMISALVLLFPRVPVHFVRIHVGILSLPPIIALLSLIFHNESVILGPWRFDSLSWLLALFVLTMGLIVQRYSIRYLLGDRSYRKYFALLTLITVADSVAWLSEDLRLLVVCWGVTLLGLICLIKIRKEWKITRKSATFMGRLFILGWLMLLFAIIWVTHATGHWQLSLVLTENSLAQLASWEKTCISLLLLLAVVIPAAQWPFHRWLLDSVVAPTPISAVMHAGIVNAGGIILTIFAPLFSGSLAQIILLVLSSISVLMGTGIMLVHVDYKRQLVGSTIAQMGFMLIQCALGAYLAAIIHAVLHGLFKSTLFLQAGSAIHNDEHHSEANQQSKPFLWIVAGGVLGLLVGIGSWLASPGVGYSFISALILGWSVAIAWTQFVAFGNGTFGRLVGFSLFAGGAIVYSIVHTSFYRLLHESVKDGIQPPTLVIIIFLFILLGGSAFGLWLTRHRSSVPYAVIYFWLVRLGEPHNDLVESHPKYLTQSLSQGGNLR